MDMVVDMLASDDGSNGVRLLCATFGALTLELQTLLLETGLDSLGVTVNVLTMLHRNNVVMMLLRKDLTVLYWLHGGVIMVLVDFTINGGCGLLMASLGDSLVDDSGSDFFVDSGVVVTSLLPARATLLALMFEHEVVRRGQASPQRKRTGFQCLPRIEQVMMVMMQMAGCL